MTVAAPEAVPDTCTTQFADLLAALKAVMATHPHGSAFHLLYAPDGLPLAEDEVLVQTVNPEKRTITLRPRRLADVRLSNVLHAAQTLSPADSQLIGHATTPVADLCQKNTLGQHGYGS